MDQIRQSPPFISVDNIEVNRDISTETNTNNAIGSELIRNERSDVHGRGRGRGHATNRLRNHQPKPHELYQRNQEFLQSLYSNNKDYRRFFPISLPTGGLINDIK